METYYLTATSQIPQDCLRRQSYGVCIFGQLGCSQDWLFGKGKDCYGQPLCGINQKTSYSYQRKATGKVESRCAASSQQLTNPHFCCCHSCYLRLASELLNHPPYSPDLAPSDFHVFRSLKDSLRGRPVDSDETVIQAINDWLKTARWKVLRWWRKSSWTSLGKCIALEGD